MQASISYSDLKDASQEAHKVAKRFDDYADELQSKVLNKISNYNGPWTSYMSDAYDLISDKVNELRTDYTRFETYSSDLDDLLDECKDVDEAVKTKIAKITADFKDANGIRNSAVENFLAYTFTSIGNSTCVGRFLGNVFDATGAGCDYIYNCIKDWFNFEGGRQFLKAMITDLLELAGAMLQFVGAVIEFAAALAETIGSYGAGTPALVFATISLISALGNLKMTIGDVTVDFFHEVMALTANRNPEDASMAYRLREIDSVSDFLRNGFILDENDTTFFNKCYFARNALAFEWDLVGVEFDIAGLVGSIGSLCTNPFSVNPYSEAGAICSTIASVLDDGFQLTDLAGPDPTGIISGSVDIGNGIGELIVDNFIDRPIDLNLILKLQSFSNISNRSFTITMPQLVISAVAFNLVLTPHLPILVLM